MFDCSLLHYPSLYRAAVHEIFLATDNTIEDIPILDEGDDENRLPDTLETEPPEASMSMRKNLLNFLLLPTIC